MKRKRFMCFNPFCLVMGLVRRRECFKQKALEKDIMAKLSELATALTDVSTKLEKARAEIVAKIAELQAALGADVDLPADVQAALDALTAKAQELDDIVPDAPAPDPTPTV